jgi:hypothetical protein
LQLDLMMFCNQMIEAAQRWYDERHHDEVVAANLANLVRFRPEGIFPHFVGVPVIA